MYLRLVLNLWEYFCLSTVRTAGMQHHYWLVVPVPKARVLKNTCVEGHRSTLWNGKLVPVVIHPGLQTLPQVPPTAGFVNLLLDHGALSGACKQCLQALGWLLGTFLIQDACVPFDGSTGMA